VAGVTHHLVPLPGDDPVDELVDAGSGRDGWDGPLEGWYDDRGWTMQDETAPLVRPAWWRWVAVAVILAMVVATPLAYAVYVLLR